MSTFKHLKPLEVVQSHSKPFKLCLHLYLYLKYLSIKPKSLSIPINPYQSLPNRYQIATNLLQSPPMLVYLKNYDCLKNSKHLDRQLWQIIKPYLTFLTNYKNYDCLKKNPKIYSTTNDP